ncbi:MAG: hypothetical protein Q9226_006220 [Calogaya cf. arnoldii]
MPSIRLKTAPDITTLATLSNDAESDMLRHKAEDENLKVLGPRREPLTRAKLLEPTFKECIEAIVGEADRNSTKKHNRKKTKEFEYDIMRTRSEENNHIYSVDLQGVKDDCKTNVVDDTVSITM